MDAVHRNSSEDVLRIVDKLIVEGQSPTHFARQLVRFLRNAMVAKVAGPDSHLLQISSDERARVGRVSELFSEEDLARFLQIMLRTHSELGYKHEQRFHLELGLLKLVHAQRLLPVEQILSGAAPVSTPQTSGGSSTRGSTTTTAAASSSASSTLNSSAPPKPGVRFNGSDNVLAPESGPAETVAIGTGDVHFTGSQAHRPTGSSPVSYSQSPSISAAAPAQALEQTLSPVSGDELRDSMLGDLESTQRSLAVFLETGEWKFGDGEIVVLVAKSDKVIDMTLGADGQRTLNALATRLAGKPTRIRVLPGGNGNGQSGAVAAPRRPATGTGARGRAIQDPIVRKMQEKFGAEIRTVIDLTEQ
jgi:DNA polymerase-3 subunit gamma/tau